VRGSQLPAARDAMCRTLRSTIAKASVIQPNRVTSPVNGNAASRPMMGPPGCPLATVAIAIATWTATAIPSEIFSANQ
jgi:hypothetical protein